MIRLGLVIVTVLLLGGCGMSNDQGADGGSTLSKAAGIKHYDDLQAALRAAITCGGATPAWEETESISHGVQDRGDGTVEYAPVSLLARSSCSEEAGEFAEATRAVEKVLDAHGGVADKVVTADKGTSGDNEVHWKDKYGGEVIFGSGQFTTLSVRSGALSGT